MLKTYVGEKIVSLTRCWEKWLSISRRLKLNPYLLFCTNINPKWIKVLNVRPEILKLLQKNIGEIFEDTGISNDFLNRIRIAQEIRARIDKWDFIKLKIFCTAKDIIIRMKRQPTE
jgi:hypothetical protein